MNLLDVRKRFLTAIERNAWLLLCVVLGALGIVMRISGGHVHSADFDGAFILWYDELAAAGGLAGLAQQVGDYSVPYQTMLALLSYFPFSALAKLKAVSCFFDIVLAAGACAIVWELSSEHNRKSYAALAFGLVFILPSVALESGYWAQCDSIWASFCLWSLYFCLKHRYLGCFIAYGAAFAFKLQAVFFLPFLLFAYLRRKDFTLAYFLLIPAVMFALCVPAILCGRSIFDLYAVYGAQVEMFPRLFIAYPSIWAFVSPNGITDYYSSISKLAIALTVAVLAIEMFLLVRSDIKVEGKSAVFVALLFAYTAVILLPGMHERYSFLVDVLAVIAAILSTSFILPAAGLAVLSITTYATHLFALPIDDYRALALINLILFALMIVACYRNFCQQNRDGIKP